MTKDQFARIKPGRAVSSSATPLATSAAGAGAPSLVGDWTGAAPDGTKISFSFKPDNSVFWLAEGPDGVMTVHAKYRIDASVAPARLEVFDIDEKNPFPDGLHGIFEFDSTNRLKLDLSGGGDGKFSERETVTLARASSPIVVPASAAPAPGAKLDPTPDPSKPPDEQQIDLGDARFHHRDWDGAIAAYNEALRINPKNSWGYRNRGAALVQKDLFENAIADYEQAIKLDPKRWQETLGEAISNLRETVRGRAKSP